MGQKRGVIDKGATQLVGNTVEQILDKLMAKLSKDQEDDKNAEKRQFANSYKISYLGDAVTIAKSTIVSSADLSKIKWPMSAPQDKTKVNPNLEIKAQPNSEQRTMAFNRDTPIIQAITSVITQSNYLVDGLKEVYPTDQQPDAKTKTQSIQKEDTNKRLKWFSIAPIITNTRFDNIVKDWVFDIEYQVRTYEIPILMSAYANATTPYYGPVKRYEYWWTGKNSEVIRYEQNMDNTYFNVALGAGDASSAATGGQAQVALATSKRQPADKLGKLNVGKEAQNSVVTDLTSPGDWAKAKIEIMGDPDWLSSENATGTESDKSFYGPDGYTIDFKSGQIFIEIKFLEAVDYEHNTGLMRVNDKILFWDYPVSISKQLDGAISYRVYTIKHNFRGGKFTQELECAINTFADVIGPKMSEAARDDSANAATNDKDMQVLSRTGVGLTKDPAPTAGSSAGNQTSMQPAASAQNTSSTGSADDDYYGR